MAITMSVKYLNFADLIVGKVRGGVVIDHHADIVGSVGATVGPGGIDTSTPDCIPTAHRCSRPAPTPRPSDSSERLGTSQIRC